MAVKNFNKLSVKMFATCVAISGFRRKKTVPENSVSFQSSAFDIFG